MKKSTFISIFVYIFMLLSVANVHASDFSKQGSTWLGGGFNFSSLGFESGDERVNKLQIAPIIRFFPVDHIMVGPSVSWTGMFAGGEAINQFEMGADVGAVFNIDDKVYPYVRSGGNLALLAGGGATASGFSLPIASGLIIPIGKIFAFQIEPAFTITWIEGTTMNLFSINLGICGIGEKSAISILQGVSGLLDFF